MSTYAEKNCQFLPRDPYA